MSDIRIAGASVPFTKEGETVAKSVEGYVLIVLNLHPETTEDHLYDVFEEYARVMNLHLNLDKLTGYAKGYALVEFKSIEDAFEVLETHKQKKIEVLGRTINIDFAFVDKRLNNSYRGGSRGIESSQDRDASPTRRR